MGNTPRLPLWNWLVEILIKILPVHLTDWDRFSIKQRHFNHEPITDPERYGGHSQAKTLKEVLTASGLKKIEIGAKSARIIK